MPRRQARPPVVTPSLPDLRWLCKRELWGGLLGMLSLLSALALVSIIRGGLGVALVGLVRGLFGWGAYPMVALSLATAAWLVGYQRLADRFLVRPSQALGLEILVLACLGLLHVASPTYQGYLLAQRGGGGGFVGWTLVLLLDGLLGRVLGALVLATGAIGGAILILDLPWALLRGMAERSLTAWREQPSRAPLAVAPDVERSARVAPEEPLQSKPPATPLKRLPGPPAETPTRRRRSRSARLPSLDLLAPASPRPSDDAEARYQAQVIEETLAQFGVPARVVDVQRGPTVTQFGVEPGFMERRRADGTTIRRKVRVSRIATLSNDLALALAAPSLRIEAPVPGRPLVGIEVPNSKTTLVNLRSVMESDAYQRIRSSLRVCLGEGVAGRPVAADLASMPHLLIAGATGSGKSVCINALVACLLLENSPEALQLILVDPKRVELTSFNGVPHLVAPVVVEVEEIVRALRWLCQEMDLRYKLFAKLRVRHIEGHNAAVQRRRGQRLPYIVVLIDELADLMMVAPDEVERYICRLAQMGRATGIHLVVATQRPSVDVLTGLIKANFPARIAFAVSTQVDSRVILDCAGAEQLLGRGDMLYMAPEANRLLRLQGCFVSDAELAAIANYWREAVAEEAEEEVEEGEAGTPWDGLPGFGSEDDTLLNEALELIREQERASTSFLQRRLHIGYSRAARLMEQLEAQGVVGPDLGGGRSREVLIAAEAGETPDENGGEEEL